MQGDTLVFAHVGDGHLTDPDAESARDDRAILAEIAELDIVDQPGDNADHGRPEQLALVRSAWPEGARRLAVRV